MADEAHQSVTESIEALDVSVIGLPKKNILIGCTGSVASIKIPILVDLLQMLHFPLEIRIVTTESALHFFDPDGLPAVVYRDADEWSAWEKMGDPVLHLELRTWADIFVISPLDSNTLAKLANGICDNLLTCIVRAWDGQKPLLFAPAMNTAMFDHPLTGQHIRILQGFNYTLIPTVVKTLACGETGDGAMAEVSTIVNTIQDVLGIPHGTSPK